MTTLNWHPAKEHHAQFIGQCLRDEEADRLKRFDPKQRAQLTFLGIHNGALSSAVINVGGTPVGQLCASPCRDLGLRLVYLGLTPHAEQVGEFDRDVMNATRRHVQGDAMAMVGSAEWGDKVQARWYQALGFRPVPEAWAAGSGIALFYTAQPGAQTLVQSYAASLDPAHVATAH
ncbi:hypothetical protein [Hydrogenophaga sp. BPS33]|uniref:hypothetical protein n=1 Tax=Hydrogenophaga sp. BPS33 TaxID=2651974 RepID=UPI0013200890|nr:hypothetical protein [Hydrogenophaga sp. BPS33]QHE86308.1 hypothetical protein F9K07_16055 [Hydrogenophaga sp. BPS33]